VTPDLGAALLRDRPRPAAGVRSDQPAGYGDLGYEIWCGRRTRKALGRLGAGGLRPRAGLDALDMVRIEAGFILLGVDYHSAPHVTIDARRSTPAELGLDWCVELEREAFLGQEALRAESARGPAWKMVGVERPGRVIPTQLRPAARARAASRGAASLRRGASGQVTSSGRRC
jgi:glycine cleavage system aminomethyltransferase T